LGALTVVLTALIFGGLATAFLTMAGLTLAVAIFLLYSSIINLAGQTEMTLEEALALVAPSREEERKRAVLRALKDLEYERSVGKIGEDDYAELTSRYREEAKQLLRAVEDARADQLALAESLAERYLAQARQAALEAAKHAADATDDTDTDDDADDDDDDAGDDDATDDDATDDDATDDDDTDTNADRDDTDDDRS
jgi:hypothetical protein